MWRPPDPCRSESGAEAPDRSDAACGPQAVRDAPVAAVDMMAHDAQHHDDAASGAVVHALAAGVLVLSPDGRVVLGNDEAERLDGVSWRRMGEPGLLTFLDADGVPLAEEQLPGRVVARTGRAVEALVIGVRRPDGSTVWIRESARPVHAPDGTLRFIVVTYVDVTAERTARLELDAAHQVVNRILTSIGDQIFSGEVLSDGTHRSTYEGPGAETLLGASFPGGVAPSGFWERSIHPEDRGRYEASLRVFTPGLDLSVEYRVIGVDGVTRWIRERVWPYQEPDGRVVFDGIVSDVSDDRAARADLAEANETMQRILGMIDEYVFTGDFAADGTFRSVFEGPGQEEILGGPLPTGPERGAVWNTRVHPDDGGKHQLHLHRIAAGTPSAAEYRLVGFDGVTRWVHDRTWPRTPQPPGGRVFDGAVTDITLRREATAALEQARADADRLARTDELTQTYNRRHARAWLAESLSGSGGPRPGVLLVDIDHFKHLNDTYGHAAGDAVLIEFARRLADVCDPQDVVARWGGEEFVVIVPDAGHGDGLDAAAERVRQAVCASPFAVEGHALRVAASVGAARPAVGRDDVDLLIAAADDALYAAKRSGRNRSWRSDRPVAVGVAALDCEAARTARTLALAARARSGAMADGLERVADLAVGVGRQLGLPRGGLLQLRLAGLLRDVGTIALSDAVQAGAARLDTRQRELLRQHVTAGEALLQGIDGLKESAPAVRHHHERWDGTGYPDGLVGAAIPFEARVVAACDLWTSMVADPASGASPKVQEARQRLRQAAGSQLDPTAVEALVRVLDEESAVTTDRDQAAARRVA